MTLVLARRMGAEAVGTAFLVMAVIGSGIAAARLSPNDIGQQLLENSLATGAALVALILALQPVSAAFNPIVTLVERILGLVATVDALALVAAQLAGDTGRIVASVEYPCRFARADRLNANAGSAGGVVGVFGLGASSAACFARMAATRACSLSLTMGA